MQLYTLLGVFCPGTFSEITGLDNTMELPCTDFTFLTTIICMGVSGFVIGCPCGIRGLGLTICLYVDPHFCKSIFIQSVNLIQRRPVSSIMYICILIYIIIYIPVLKYLVCLILFYTLEYNLILYN